MEKDIWLFSQRQNRWCPKTLLRRKASVWAWPTDAASDGIFVILSILTLCPRLVGVCIPIRRPWVHPDQALIKCDGEVENKGGNASLLTSHAGSSRVDPDSLTNRVMEPVDHPSHRDWIDPRRRPILGWRYAVITWCHSLTVLDASSCNKQFLLKAPFVSRDHHTGDESEHMRLRHL